MKKLVVIGGSGALGKSILHTFKFIKPSWKVMNLDFKSNPEADVNYTIKSSPISKKEITEIHKEEFINSNGIDCIVNAAGGWTGGGIEDLDIIESVNTMINMNLYSSILAAHLAKLYLNKNSLFVLTGAHAVKNQMNPNMLGYHLSKYATHHLADMLVETNQLKENSKVITILPTTIDTEANRKAMPDADFTKWTKPETIATVIKDWADNKNYPKENYFKV
jgi:dihydropteridine reductase